MILGDLHHFARERHLYPVAIQKGIDCLVTERIAEREPGKYEIDGTLLFALVQEMTTKSWVDNSPESHVIYTDIQYLIRGEEKIGVTRLSAEHRIIKDQLDTNDIAFYESMGNESEVVLTPGMFAVFFPTDVHRPCCHVNGESSIKKVVIKIHRQLWNES